MSGEKVEFGATNEGEGATGKRPRERSSIEFPYAGLEDAIEVARAVHSYGGNQCTTAQVATQMDQSLTSGSFRLKAAAAGLFGLTLNERKTIRLTPLGRRALDPGQERHAKAEAFLNVPLYKAIYDDHEGQILPPAVALERQMAELGVAKKQTDKARQVFERSAAHAGFYAQGSNRLVMPVAMGSSGADQKDSNSAGNLPDREKPGGSGNGGGGGDKDALHPFIRGLIDKLPEAEKVWPMSERKKWLDTAANIFSLMYKEPDGGT